MKRLCVAGASCLLFVLGTLVFSTSAEAGGGQDKKKKKMDSSAEFKKLDKNEDGKLSKDEFKKIEIGKKKEGKEARAEKMADRLFGELDADKDGFLSPDEFKKLEEKIGELRKKKSK